MSARGNIQSYALDCMMSRKSIGEGDSSTESLKEDYTSRGIKIKIHQASSPVKNLLLTFAWYKHLACVSKQGGPFLQGSKYLERSEQDSSLSYLSSHTCKRVFPNLASKSVFEISLCRTV